MVSQERGTNTCMYMYKEMRSIKTKLKKEVRLETTLRKGSSLTSRLSLFQIFYEKRKREAVFSQDARTAVAGPLHQGKGKL